MDYVVRLDSFEGPLDLLLYLIKKNEVSIYDIPIAKITDEYLNVIETMQEMNLDVAGDFLVMATTLMYIKSRMLLPIYKSDGEEDGITEPGQDPREELVRLLVEYQQFQDAGKKLGMRPILGRDTFVNPQYKSGEKPPLKDMALFSLVNSFQKLIEKQKRKESFHQIYMPGKTVEQKTAELISRYPEGFLNLSIEELLAEPLTRNEIVVTFLAILELSKLNFIKIIQVSPDSDILITTIKPLNTMDLNTFRKNSLLKEAAFVIKPFEGE